MDNNLQSVNATSVDISLPSALQLKFHCTGTGLIIYVTIKGVTESVHANLLVGSAAWSHRGQIFEGPDSQHQNQELYRLQKYFADTYKQLWDTGDVTPSRLLASFIKDHAKVIFQSPVSNDITAAKQKVLAEIERHLKNRPHRSKKRTEIFEERLAALNNRLSALNAKEKHASLQPVRKVEESVTDKRRTKLNASMKVRFVLRKNRTNKMGLCPIEFLVRINSVISTRCSTRIRVNPLQWDSKCQAIIGNETDTKTLHTIREGLDAVYLEFRKRGKTPTPKMVIDTYFNHDVEFDKRWTVYDFIGLQLNELRKRGRSKATLEMYERTYLSFMEHSGIVRIEDVSRSHIKDYWEWLRHTKNLSQDFCNKSCQRLFGLFEGAVSNGVINQNPAKGLKFDWEGKVDLTCLSESELEELKMREWSPTLQKVVNAFLFMCYTGLHIADYQKLTNANLKSYQGTRFIEYRRQKTGSIAKIPLHSYATKLIAHYGSIEALPRISNQKQNQHLKVIAELLQTEKKLTNKVARKTFTDMSINDRGMSFEAVASMLGHSSTKFVKVYGQVAHRRIFAEWKE
jgi:site-specific recombinase XerD